MNRLKKMLSRRGVAGIGAVAVVVAATSCDTDVVNPGPIDATFLDEAASQDAIMNGAGRAFSAALNWIGYTSAAIAREVHPSGSTGSFGITPEQQGGELLDDQVGTAWENAHRARFLAADGIRRIEALDAADRKQDVLAELYLWAGYTSRLLGEQMCSSVYDGGPAGSSDLHLADAVGYFTQAASLGSAEIATAATAGRAAAHLMAGDYSSAVADANAALSMSGGNFSHIVPYFDIGDDDQSNRIYVAGKAEPYKAHSQIFTWIAEYNPETGGVADGDPRVSWRVSGENGDAASSCCGLIEWNPQTKYTTDDASIELSSDEEMKLILAEVELRTNGAAGMAAAVALVDELRTAAGQATEAPATLDEAWTYFKREHAIEMWLEGRRLPALRRWNDAGDPETHLQLLEQVGDGNTATTSHLLTRDFCFPVSEGEKQTNPNIDISFTG